METKVKKLLVSKITDKPVIWDVGNVDGNVFSVLSEAKKAIVRDGYDVEVFDELYSRVTSSKSYNDALLIISEYVEFRF